MKLEFLDEVNEYRDQVIRLYDFDKAQAILFRDALQKTVVNGNESLDLSKLDFIEPVNCKLILHIADEDTGIFSIDDKTFFCDLTLDGYKNMIRLLEPFCLKETKSFVMLYDLDTEIDFLFAPYAG